MALIKCPECGREVSNRAAACIHCGFPLETVEPAQNEYPNASIEISRLVSEADKLKAEKNYTKAFQLYMEAAQMGDAYSQVWVGNFFNRGVVVEKDYKSAVMWFEKAAKQNNAFALNNLARMYEQGTGVSQNFEKAIELYRLASNAGEKTASQNLGIMYENGKGVPQNYESAVRYYNIAISQGNTDPVLLNNLGVLYADGKGTAPDYEKAEKLFTLAFQKGNDQARVNLNAIKQKRALNQDTQKSPASSSGKKKTISKLTWVVIVDIIIFALAIWWSVVDFGSFNAGFVFALAFAIVVVSGVIYFYFISDNAPTAKEMKEISDREKYCNYRYTCPVCGSKKVKRISTLNRGFSVYLLGLASSKIGKQYECDSCKHKW